MNKFRCMSAMLFVIMVVMVMRWSAVGGAEPSVDVSDIQASYVFNGACIDVKVIGYKNHKVSEIIGGGFIIQYNPSVIKIEAMTVESWSGGWKELEPGILQFSYTDVITADDQLVTYNYYTSIGFSVIGIGSPEFQLLESYCRTPAGDKIPIATEVTYDNDWKTILPVCEYDKETKVLHVSGEGTVYTSVLPDGFLDAYAEAKELVITGNMFIEGKAFANYSNLEKVTMGEGVSTSTNTFPDIYHELTICGAPMSAAERIATEKKYSFEPTEDILKGDIDQNECLNAVDALNILEMTVGSRLHPKYGYTADVNGDGYVNANDALLVLQRAANMSI